MTTVMQVLEGILTAKLKQYMDGDLIYDALREVPEFNALDIETMLKIRDALVSQVEQGGVQVIVKLPNSKTFAKQRRDRKAQS